MRAYSAVLGWVRRRPGLFALIFGFHPPPGLRAILWDWTTLLLRSCLRDRLRSDMSLLDMGTGPAAVLAIYARCRLGCRRVYAVDYVPSVVESARLATRHAGVDIDVREGSLFESVAESFDVIAFNAPYIDAGSGARLRLLSAEIDGLRFSGGNDGLRTVERFLAEAPRFLAPGGRVLLGVNHFYVSRDGVQEIVQRHGWRTEQVRRGACTGATVYSVVRPPA